MNLIIMLPFTDPHSIIEYVTYFFMNDMFIYVTLLLKFLPHVEVYIYIYGRIAHLMVFAFLYI